MDFKALQLRLRDFATARDWQSFHSPKNLAMALMVEAAELLELFQWLTTEQSNTLTKDAADKERVGDEIADVLLYLLQLADCAGIDVEQAVEHKLYKNAKKHPAKHPEKPAPGPKTHLLIDWENVQPKGAELRALVPEGSDVWLFHSPEQKIDASSHQLTYGASKVTLIPRSGAGKNALDFQLSYYMGYISARQPDEQFVVVSNDKGYDSMLTHARELGFSAIRREFRKPPTAPMVAPVQRKTIPVAMPRPKPASITIPLPQSLPALEPSAAQIAWRAILHLRQLPPECRPTQPESWQVLMESLIREPVLDKTGLAQRAFLLVQGRHLGVARAPLTKNELRTVAPNRTPPVPKVAIQNAAITKALVEMPKATRPKPVTKKPPVPSRAAAPTSAKEALTITTAQLVQRVLASLNKTSSNKPKRRAGLLNFIETHIPVTNNRTAIAELVYLSLEKQKHINLSKNSGKVTYSTPKPKPSANTQAMNTSQKIVIQTTN